MLSVFQTKPKYSSAILVRRFEQPRQPYALARVRTHLGSTVGHCFGFRHWEGGRKLTGNDVLDFRQAAETGNAFGSHLQRGRSLKSRRTCIYRSVKRKDRSY